MSDNVTPLFGDKNPPQSKTEEAKAQAFPVQPLWRKGAEYMDMGMLSITEWIPITKEGERDTTRQNIFLGKTDLNIPGMGQIPLPFMLPAPNLSVAVAMYGTTLERAAKTFVHKLQQDQLDKSKQIILPGMSPTPQPQQRGGRPPSFP